MESIGGLKNKSTSSTIQSNAQSSGKLKIKSKIIDGVVAAVSIQANDNTTINQNIILPESTGSKNETLRIKNDVTNNNEELEWYRVPEDSYSDLSNDRDVEFDIDVSNLNLNTGLSFDTDGGDFSNLINNKIGEDNNTAQYVRFNVSSNPPIYPQSFTYTPDPTNDHSLRKVQMWIRKYGSGTETDKTMFPSKFEIHGIPRGGSSSDSVLITTINSPEVNNMNYSASTEYDLNNPVIDESFNPDGLIYDSYEFKIYGNRVDTNNENYYKPVIGEIKLFGRKVIRNFTNNTIYQLQGISKFETLNVKVVTSSESVNKGDVYKTDLNTSITADNYYTINDITTPNLKFRTGQIYIFNQDDSSNDGHPITFYTDRVKNTEYINTDNIKYIINDTEYEISSAYNEHFGTNRYRRVKILITDDMPGRLYYQCINHSNMGGVIETGTATSSGGGSTLTVQDEGIDLSTEATTLNFEGSGVTASGSGATKTITINNELTNWSEDSNGNILPNTNADYDIGSAEKKVRHLFLSDNSLYMGSGADTNAGTAISLDGDGDLKVGDTKLIKGDASGNLPSSKLPSGIQTVTPQHTDNVLSGLTIGGTQYTVPSGGSGGGTTVTAHTDTQTGNEEFLSALTVDGTKYKVGTSVQQVSYSDTSKLLLSYPFSAAANATDAQTNYGSLTPDTTVFDYTEFVSGEGFQLRSSVNANDDNINITKSSGSFVDNEFTIYIRFKVRDDLTGDSNARIFESRNANDDSSSRIVINFESNASGAGTPNANFGFWTGSDNYFNELNPFGAGSISVGVWYHTFISLNFNTLRGHVFMNPNGGSTLNSYEMSGLTVTPEIANIQLNTTNADNNYHHNIDLANFSLFNYALSIDGAQQWMDYVDRGYVNQGNPAPLKYLADVSETPPNTNDVLFYNGTEWTGGFTELLQSVSRIGAGYGPPEGFINDNPSNTHIRGSAPPLGQSAVYIPTAFQSNCVIVAVTGMNRLFDNISNNVAINLRSNGPPSTSVPYVLEIAIDVPKVVTNYAMYRPSNASLPYPQAWDFQVYNPATSAWVTLDTKTGQSITSSSTRPSEQTSGFVTDSVSTSILSRLYRFSFTQSSLNSYIQFGEIGMTFKQPTSVTEIGSVNTSSTPSNGDSLVYSSLSNQWMPQRAASQFGLPAGDNAKLWVVAGESFSRIGNYPIEHVGTTGRTFNYDGDGHLYLNNSQSGDFNYLKISSSSATVHPNSSFTVAAVVYFDLSASNVSDTTHRSIIWGQGASSDGTALYHSSPLLFNNHHYERIEFDYYRDSPDANPFRFSTTSLVGKMLLVMTRESTNGSIDSNATVTLYKNGNKVNQITGTDTLNTANNSLSVDEVILTGSVNRYGFFDNQKFYAAAVWDRVLTTDEISQLSIDKLVTKRQTMPVSDLGDITNVSTAAPSNGDSLVYSSLSSQWVPQKPTSLYSLPAVDNAKIWVVAGESFSRIGNYPIEHVGTGRTFNHDGDGHRYLNHSNGANYLRITDSNAMINFSTSSYTFAVVVDLSLLDGGSGGNIYGQTIIFEYNTPYTGTDYKTQLFYFANQNSGTPGTLGIDYWFPNGDPFMHTPSTSSLYEGKALIVVTYQNTSSTSQTISIYKNGTQQFTNTASDILSSTGTNTEWRIAGAGSTQGGFQTSKFYAAAVWDRVLTTDEISQLTIDKLVKTTVSANPTAPATADLTKVSIGGTAYNVGERRITAFRLQQATAILNLGYLAVFPINSTTGTADQAATSTKLGVVKFGSALEVTADNYVVLPANSTWFASVSMPVRGDPDVDKRVVLIQVESKTPTGSPALKFQFSPDSHNDWDGSIEYTLYSPSHIFSITNDTHIRFTSIGSTTSYQNTNVVWHSGTDNGINFIRLQ